MKRFDYSRVALMIGFVLSDSIETYLYQTMQFYTFSELFIRPIFLVLILVSAFSIYSGIKIINKKDKIANTKSDILNAKSRPQWVFLILLSIISIYTVFVTDHLQYLGKIFPISVGLFMFFFSLIIGIQMFISKSGSKVTIFWFISPLFLSVFIGFYISIGLFVFIFLSKIARASFRFSLVSAIGVWIALAAISHFMIMDFPPGILQGYIELPWPIN